VFVGLAGGSDGPGGDALVESIDGDLLFGGVDGAFLRQEQARAEGGGAGQKQSRPPANLVFPGRASGGTLTACLPSKPAGKSSSWEFMACSQVICCPV